MIMVTVFQLISCVSIPIAFVKLRKTQANAERGFRVPFGLTASYVIFLVITFLLLEATFKALLLSLITHVVFFIIYTFTFYRGRIKNIFQAFASAWSIFAYLLFATVFSYIFERHIMSVPWFTITFLALATISYITLLKQRCYTEAVCMEGEV